MCQFFFVYSYPLNECEGECRGIGGSPWDLTCPTSQLGKGGFSLDAGLVRAGGTGRATSKVVFKTSLYSSKDNQTSAFRIHDSLAYRSIVLITS